MAMNVHDLLRLKCTQMLAAEQDILRMNNMMAQEVQNPRLKDMLVQHAAPTQQQIDNLQMVLNRLGGPMEPQGMVEKVEERMGMGGTMQHTPVTQGMMRAHEEFKAMNPAQQLVDINDALEGDKVEHFEIASYTGLIALARQLGQDEVVQMLQQNLGGEEQMRTRIESDLPSLLAELAGPGRMAA